ncbi:MAG: hypothetical protein P4L46_22125 [Fimbriimonas sp.]|nr:hypothetical protein [Fimbriimonas sp.]
MTTMRTMPPPPRNVRIKRSSHILRVFVWVLLALTGFGIPLGMNRQTHRLTLLMEQGHIVHAQVITGRISRGKSTSHYLTITFSDRGFVYSGEQRVPYYIYDTYVQAPEVPVVTMPDDPSSFEVGEMTQDRIDHAKLPWEVLGSMFAVVIVFVLGSIEYTLNFERRLLTKGQVAIGRVEALIPGKTSYVKYTYVTRFGERAAKRSTPTVRRFTVGEEIEVLYDPDNDRDSLPTSLFQMCEIA